MGGDREDIVRLILEVPSEMMRGNRQKLEHEKFQLAIREFFFTLRMLKHWHRYPREAGDTQTSTGQSSK